MTPETSGEMTRRTALIAGAAAVATAAGCAEAPSAKGDGAKTGASARMPVVYMPHGGGPWPFVDLGVSKAEFDGFMAYLRELPALTKRVAERTPAVEAPPKAIVVVSAHWEEAVPTVMTSASPPLLFDYYGFPEGAYKLTWPAPGHVGVAARVRELLGAAGIATAEDAKRGFDHGTFVPLKVAYPAAEVPTVQLSLKKGLDPEEHLAIGRALAPLRDEGVFIVGSGSSFHNMRGFGAANADALSAPFDAWLRESVVLPPAERDARLAAWASAPGARAAHPREEHLLPLMVVAGAAGADVGTVPWGGTFMKARFSAVHFG